MYTYEYIYIYIYITTIWPPARRGALAEDGLRGAQHVAGRDRRPLYCNTCLCSINTYICVYIYIYIHTTHSVV